MEKIVVKVGRKKRKFEFPSNWDKINGSDFTTIYRFVNKEIEEAELIACLIKGKLKHLAKVPGTYFAEAFLPLLKFLEREPVTNWYFDKIQRNTDVILYGPSDNYGTILTGEFAFADTYFAKFQETMDETFLDKCMAVLMRERDEDADENSQSFNGDFRLPFNENLIGKQAERLAKLPQAIKMAFAWNYIIFRTFIETNYKWVFQKSSKNDGSGWSSVMRGMCKGDITKLDNVAKIPLLVFLEELNDGIKENSK